MYSKKQLSELKTHYGYSHIIKLLFTIILILTVKTGNSQQCNCDQNPELKETISCRALHLKNHAKIYWQYNCDSSWLVFENRRKKEILYSLEAGLIGYTEKLGYSYAAEYKSTFLIRNNVISGCCDPSEFILFDKENGKEKINMGRLIFYSEVSNHPIVVYFENSNYQPFNGSKIDHNNLTLRNINNNKIYKIKLPKGRIQTTIKLSGEMFPEHLIDQAEIINNNLIIKYRFKTKVTGDGWLIGKIVIDLSKYSY